MAQSTVSPNNKAVTFRGRTEREMPKPPNMDVTPKPAVKHPAGIKNRAAISKRKFAKRAMKRGMISESAAKKHLGESY